MDLAYTIGITLLTLGVLVAVHEFGHFWVARRCGVKVLRFSIGFGKSIYTWQDRHGTEFCIALIPLGGYVKMLDEREGEVAAGERELAFNRKPVLQRIAVVAAGPIANFLLAIVAYWFLFMAGESGYAPVIGAVKPGSVADIAGLEAGQEIVAVDGKETPTWQALSFRLLDRIGDTGTVQFSVKYPDSGMIYESEGQLQQWLGDDESPDLLTGLGITPYAPSVPPVVSEVVADSPAERAGLLPGDRVLSADGTPMAEWLEWVAYVRDRPGQPIALEVQRGNDTVAMQIVPDAETDSAGETIGRVGIAVSMPALPEGMLREFERGPVASLGAAFLRTGDLVGFTLSSIKKMIQGLISPKN